MWLCLVQLYCKKASCAAWESACGFPVPVEHKVPKMADAGGNKSQRCPFFLKSTVNFPSSWQVCVFHLPFASFSPYKSTASFLSASAVCHVYNFFFLKDTAACWEETEKARVLDFWSRRWTRPRLPSCSWLNHKTYNRICVSSTIRSPVGDEERERERERTFPVWCNVISLAVMSLLPSPPP